PHRPAPPAPSTLSLHDALPISAANILEDGSINGKNGAPNFDGASGEQPVRNLVDEAVKTTLEQLELDTPERAAAFFARHPAADLDRKSTRLNSSHVAISYAVFC